MTRFNVLRIHEFAADNRQNAVQRVADLSRKRFGGLP